MNNKWMVAIPVVMLALALTILFGWGVGLAQMPHAADLVVTKSVDQPVTAPGQAVIYTVVLSNTTSALLEVSSLADTLPAGFEYIGLAPGSEWTVEPWDNVAPEIRWSGPISVPVSDTLTLRYWVYIPPTVPVSDVPHVNTVVANIGSDEYTAQASLLVAIGEVTASKTASASRVDSGEPVTYTVSFSNTGHVPVALAVVSDVLPAGVTFLAMTADSDIQTAPATSGTLVWTGPFTIASHAELVAQYVTAMPLVSDTEYLENQAWGRLGDGTVVGPVGQEIVVSAGGPMTVCLPIVLRYYAPPAFSIAKTANPTSAFAQDPGALITYTVTVENIGTVPGELADIRDSLPAGFVFQAMLPGSDVAASPDGTTGTIVWNGPFSVDGESTLTLQYLVQASTEVGDYVNTATTTVSVGQPPAAPATATVTLIDPIFLEDHFDYDANGWVPFLNKSNRLRPEQWYWEGGVGHPGGCYNHCRYFGNPPYPADDALAMYLVDGSEEWSNYRYELDVWMDPDTQLFSLWFYGHYQDSPNEGQWVLGYYLEFNPGHKWVKVWQTQTPDDCVGDTCTTPGWQYNFSNPMMIYQAPDFYYGGGFKGSWHHVAVEVRNVGEGTNIKGFVDGVQALEFTDTEGTIIQNGTVGLATYKAPLIRFDNVQVTRLP